MANSHITFVSTVNINIGRINHLLKLYRLSKEDFVFRINEGLKRQLSETEIFKTEIKISILARIDSIFKKGLNYYLDPKELRENKEESIFFRKNHFNADLSFGAKQIVNHFEEEKIALSALSKLSDIRMDRLLPVFTVNSSPQKVAAKVRQSLYPQFNKDRKEFLKALIYKFAEFNILVFEFIETWNKIERANINGFYLTPNVIVLKRNQKSFRREIFTLVHELGHYLLNVEEIDDKTSEDLINYNSLNQVEKWCNDFAYHFLAGNHDLTISGLVQASSKNDFHHDLIAQISEKTNLSTISLYTRLLINNTISTDNYKIVSEGILESIRERENRIQLERESAKKKAEEEGRKLGGATPKAIQSPLYVKTIQTAFFEGVINESELCKRLNIKAGKIDKYLQ